MRELDENRRFAAETIKREWLRLTKNVPISTSEAIFAILDVIVESGKSPRHLWDHGTYLEFAHYPEGVSDGLAELEPVNRPIWVDYCSPGARAELLDLLQHLVIDDPATHGLTDRPKDL